MFQQINLFVHAMAFSQAILLILTGVLLCKRGIAAQLLIPFGLSVSAVILTPLSIHFHWPSMFVWSMFLEALVPLFFWYLTESIFTDGFRWRPYHLLGLPILIITALLIASSPADLVDFHKQSSWLLNLHRSFDIAFIFLALRVIVSGWGNDLVDIRLTLRWFGMLFSASFLLAGLAFDLYFLQTRSITNPQSLVTMAFVFICLLGCNLILILFKDLLLPQIQTPVMNTSVGEQDNPHSTRNAEDSQLLAGLLDKLMQEDKVFKKAGLTLEDLAEISHHPVYKLRNFINNKLGYRNFNQFLGHYRIQEAKFMLKNKDFKDEKIISLALDVGYSSLAPFNKAFKDHLGMTPSEYRKSQIPDDSSSNLQ